MNAAALEGAFVRGTLKDEEIVTVSSITIKKASTKENPVVLKVAQQPVASLKASTSSAFQPEVILETAFAIVEMQILLR